jgi:hypothetical protein
VWALPVVALVAVVAGAIAPRVFVDESTVARISFENPTVYAINIKVSGARRDGWLPLGRAERGTTTQFDNVIDQGAVWILHFDSQGRDVGELRLTREVLMRSGWKVVIPTSVGEALASDGAPPTPLQQGGS